jgi:DNA-binding NarL/FixJ family response regulator
VIRLAIADDHPIVREGLRRIASEDAGISVVGEASSAAELFSLLAAAAVDVVLLDVTMPGATFVDTLGELRDRHSSIKVLVLSAHPEDQWAVRALRAGAAGYLTKDRSPDERLSDREFEVLRALGSGMMVKDVAKQLRLSAKTVSTYRTRLLEKMGLETKADLVRYVVAHNLFS